MLVAAVLVLALTGPPTAARAAAAGPINTTAQGLRVGIGLLGISDALSLALPAVKRSWTTGGNTSTASTLGTTLYVPLSTTQILNVGAVNATAAPVAGGGKAEAGTAGLGVLGALSVDAVSTSCTMTASNITTTTNIANLNVAGQPVNPAVGLGVGAPGILTATVDKRVAAYNTSTGRLDYTVRALDIDLLDGVVASGSIVVAESTCSGIVKLGAVNLTSTSVVPGAAAVVPKVAVTNTGDIAAPNTTIRIPAPPAGYTLGTPTVTGGGTCTASSTFITCTGVTVPGQGSVLVSLPVSLAASATSAQNWAPSANSITAVSTPIAGVSGTTISVDGGGTLVTALAPVSTGGSITVNPMNLAAGKAATTTLTVSNQGPSDATTTITVPIVGADKPAGVSVVSATVAGNPCTVSASAITCTGVRVPGSGSTAISVRAAATITTPPGATWDLTGITGTLNGTPITGSGRLLTVSDPDVNLDAGVTITPATAVPGGSQATATVGVRNIGIIPATGTTITLPAPPAGYTVGAVTTTGGGTCTTSGAITCTGVTVPANGSVTVSVPVTLAAGVTASWTAPGGSPVSATSGDSTGTASGTIVTADPRWTLGVTSSGPAARTVRPGQTATMTVTVRDLGPSDARNAEFVVKAPTGTTFGTLTGAAGACAQLSPTTLRCTEDIPVAGPDVVLTLPLVVSGQADPAVPLADGCVSLNNDLDCDDAADVALASIELRTPLADRLTAATTSATIVPGHDGTGRVRLTSTQTEDDLVVTVPKAALPTGFTVTAATVTGGSCTLGGPDVVCSGVDLTAGQTRDISLTIAAASSVTPPATWTATGIMVSDGGEDVTIDGALATAGTPASTLSATVSGPPDNTVLPGETTSVTVTVTNEGPSDNPAATFTVTAPTGTTFGTPTAPTDGICVLANGGGSAVCTLPLADGASSPALVLPVVVPPGTNSMTPLTGGCADLDNNGSCGDPGDVALDPILLRVPFDERVTIGAVPATVTPGATATARVTVTAVHGDQSGLTLTVPTGSLPAELTVTAATSTAAACVVNNGDVTCTGLEIQDGATATVELTVRADPASIAGLTWTATGVTVADGSGGQLAEDPLLATTGTPVFVLDPTVTVPAPGTVQAGQVGTIGVTVDNQGPSDALGATFGVLAPTGTTFQALTGATATVCALEPGNQRAICTTTLPATAPDLVLSFDVLVDPGADSAVAVSGGCIDLNNTATCTTPPDRAITDIWLAKALSERLTIGTTAATIVPGEFGLGRVTLTSSRPESNLTVTVPKAALPAGFTAAPVGGACTADTNAITCTGVDLTANTPLDLAVRVTVASSVVPPVTWTVAGIDVAAGSDHATGGGPLAIAGTPATGVSATVAGPADGTVNAGDTTTLTVVVSNAGPSDVTGRTVTISAPAPSTTFGTLTGDAATLCTVSNPTLVTCTVSLAATTSTPQLDLPLVIDPAADPFTPIAGGCVEIDGVAGCGNADTDVDTIVLRVPFDRLARIDTAAATVTPGTEDTATVGVHALHGNLTNVTLTVPLADVPPELTVTTTDPGCTVGNGEIRCTGIDAADQTTTTITLRVLALPSAAAGVTWTANGITAAAAAGQVAANRALAVTGTPVHLLDATVTPPAQPILPGGTGNLSVAVDNLGPSDVTQAVIGVNAPAGATFGTLTAPTSDACTANAGRTRLSCTFDLAAAAPVITFPVPLVVDPGATAANPPTGGCVDLDNNGTCTGADEPLPPVTVATPFAEQITVSTTPAEPAAGENDIGRVVVTTDRAQTGLTVVVPLAGKPADVFLGSPSISPAGTCTADATEIRCTGVDIAAGNAATITVPLSVTPSAPANLTWNATSITVTNAGGDTASGNGLLLQTGAAAYRLTATSTGPAAGTVLPGGTADLTLTLDNSGPSDALNAPVTVRAPVGTTFGPLDGPAAQACTPNPASTALTCTVTLAVTDRSLVWTLPVILPGNADPQVALTGGCADLDGDNACGGTDDAVLPDITARAPLGTVLTLSADDPPVTPGSTGTATLTIAASQARTGLTISIDTGTLPTGLTATGATVAGNACAAGNGVLECTGVDIPGGGDARVVLALSATADAPQGGVWTPTVTVTGGGETITGSPQTATVGVPVHPLSVTVGVPASGTLLPGGTGDLSVAVTNAGPSSYPNARVAFRAPTGATFATPLPAPASASCSRTSPALVECTFTLAAETRTFTLPVVVPPNADPDVVLDGGCVDINLDGACTGAPDQPIADIQLATPLAADARLTVETGTAVPGDTAATGYVVIDADRAFTGLTVAIPRNALPTGFTVDGASGPSGTTCTLTPDIVCTGVNLGTGQRRVIAVTVRAAANLGSGVDWSAGPITLTNAGGESSQTTGTLISTGSPVASVTYATTVSAPGTVEPGGTATLTVTVTNAGPSDATGRTTSILAPTGTTFGTLTGQAQANCTPVTGDTRLNCAFGLNAGAAPLVWSIPLLVSSLADPAVVVSGGCLDEAGDGACTGDDPLPGLTLRRTLDQALTVSADNPSITPGQTGTATVTVASADNRTGLDVTIPLASLPAGLTATAAQRGGTPCIVSAATISCTGVSLTGGGSTAIVITLSAASSATGGGVWSPGIAVATVTRTVAVATVGAPATGVTVAVVPPAAGTVLPGGTGDLAVTVSNAGPSDARPYRVAFQAPARTTFLAPTVGYCDLTSSTEISCAVEVDAADSVTFNLPVSVLSNADPATPVSGGCVDTDNNGSCNTTVPSFTLATPLAGRVQLSLTPVTVTPGLTGTALVRATADGALTGTTVTVPLAGLPAGLTVETFGGPAGSTCARDSVRIVCTGVNLTTGANTAVSLTVRAASNLAPGVTWTAGGITLADGTQTISGGGQVAVTGTPIAPVAFAVAGPTGTVAPGATTAMTITITNPGPSDATSVTATVVAPGNTTFGTLSGQAAANCSRTSSTLLTCTFSQAATAATLVWTVPLIVSSTATTGDTVSGGCVSVNADTRCTDSVDVEGPEFSVGRPLIETTQLLLGPATIAAGDNGTATVTVTSTADNEALTLTVPLGQLPTGFDVTGATLGDAACTVTPASIVCSDVSLSAGEPLVLSIALGVAPTVAAGTTWQATGITLVNTADVTDRITAGGKLAGTTATGAAVTVSVGTPSVRRPAPGQTTILPITVANAGPGDADPYTATIVLPARTTHGTLPSGCTEGTTDRTVKCTLSLAPGETADLSIPLVVDEDASVGSTISGGCVDTDGDGTCGSDEDVALPNLTVVAPSVDLEIEYANPKPTVVRGKPILLRLPYSNNGSQSAADVVFVIDPPAGVTLTRAAILLDASSAAFTAAGTGAQAAAASTIDATCVPAPDIDSNAARCTGPEAPIGTASELWLYLAVAQTAKAGTYPISVMISTTSPEGDTVNNTATADLTIAAGTTPDPDDIVIPAPGTDPSDSNQGTNGGGALPKTGQDLTGLLLLSVLLVVGGVLARVAARGRRTR
ncbi:hypothetical protein AFR_19510 [Actinoplanes friuliensis DSM 7358]|uniref:DUF11 domain-containing protein n=1 Tax=Actinoplanes friuliensis DSM 7358 TaxID=1246995 RepID=U5VZ79_9ACTN|nr:hypothetical protein AFR_19510 [Actinoplanes friuliensis DSM 7358]